jgi:hypothetical protein
MKRMKRAFVAVAVAAVFCLGFASEAKADIIWDSTFNHLGPIGNPDDEAAFLEADVFLAKHEGEDGWVDGAISGEDYITITYSEDGLSALIEYDLTGSGYEMEYILLKDGVIDGQHLYSLWVPTADQTVIGSGIVYFADPNDPTVMLDRQISHISFFGTEGERDVPEPATLLLFGLGLLATNRLRRIRLT